MIDLITDLRKAALLGPRVWADLARAVAELAAARWRLARLDTKRLIEPEASAPHPPVSAAVLSPAAIRTTDRVEFAIVRMGPRVPWRGDCLVQALAARRWLASAGIGSDLHIGVRSDGGFAAHAWLTVGDRIVTGGPICEYTPLLGPGNAAQPRSAAEFSTNQR